MVLLLYKIIAHSNLNWKDKYKMLANLLNVSSKNVYSKENLSTSLKSMMILSMKKLTKYSIM